MTEKKKAMARTCLKCGRVRASFPWFRPQGDHCGPCRLGLKAEAALGRIFRKRALAWLTRVP